MTFTEALSAIFDDGDRVTRAKWANRAIYLVLDEHRLCTTWDSTTSKVDGLLHPMIVDEQDYFADDWEVVE